ncbi:MAG: hypothetical protein WHX53_14975, partial [Anaerolineae bacterium]
MSETSNVKRQTSGVKRQASNVVTLIAGGTLIGGDGAGRGEAIGWVAVEGERIAAVGWGAAPAEWRARADRV